MTVVPGKVGWPILGDTSYSFYKDPTGYIDKNMNTYKSRVFKSRFLTKPTVFVGSNKGVHDVLNDKSGALDLGYRSFMYQVYGDNLLFLNDDESKQLRECLHELFNHDNIKHYQQTVEKIASRHIEELDVSEPQCVYTTMKRISTEICLSLFLDLDFEESGNLANTILSLTRTHWHGIISVPLPIKLPSGNASTFSKALEAKAALLQVIENKLQKKSEFAAKLESLTNYQDALNHLLLFTSALVPKAIASLLTSFFTATGQHDQLSCQEYLLTDSVFMECVLLEVQRLFPPFIGGRRLVRKICTIDGYSVEEGQAIVYLTHSAHRDPDVFHEPEKFDPTRWKDRNAGDKGKLFSFGAGLRGCIGKHFVMTIVHDVLQRFMQRYHWKLVSDQNVTPKWLPVSRPRQAVMMEITLRNSTQ